MAERLAVNVAENPAELYSSAVWKAELVSEEDG